MLYEWIVTLRPQLFRKAAALAFPWLFAAAVQAQIPKEDITHTSSLGQKFVSVAGTPALIATHETKLGDWKAFVSESGHAWDFKPHFDQTDDHPVVGVTLEDARAFCLWLTDKERKEGKLNSAQGYRLPTQGDWDAAVGLTRMKKPDLTVEEKVNDDRVFPWGMAWPPPANTANLAEGEIEGYSDGTPFTAPVGSFRANGDGIYDLSGNVWEWCWDPEIRADQIGILRGGSWAYFRQETLRSAYLYAVPTDLRMPTVGFRCVYEDKQRSATLIAAAETVKAQMRTQKREDLLGGKVDNAEVAAMREKLSSQMAAANGATVPAADLKPAVAGSSFTSSSGLDFVPLPEAGADLLFGATEVRLQDVEVWLQTVGREWPGRPNFLKEADHPAVGVSWEEAVAFADWLTLRDRSQKLIPETAAYRLPTDAEWSLAAGLKDEKGNTPEEKSLTATTHYPWSSEGAFPPPRSSTNLDANRISGHYDRHAYTAPVQDEAANALGIRGLGGNASEWCQDVWPGDNAERVVRGGSWLTRERDDLRTGVRQHAAANAGNSGIGFRLVLELPAAP